MEPVPFFEQLSARAREIDSLLCVGLDPHPQDLAKIEGAADMAEASITFCTVRPPPRPCLPHQSLSLSRLSRQDAVGDVAALVFPRCARADALS